MREKEAHWYIWSSLLSYLLFNFEWHVRFIAKEGFQCWWHCVVLFLIVWCQLIFEMACLHWEEKGKSFWLTGYLFSKRQDLEFASSIKWLLLKFTASSKTWIEKDVFSSCHEHGSKKKFWVPKRNWTSDLHILRSDALSLSHGDSTASSVYYKVHMTRVLHTARISNVNRISFYIFLLSSKLIISLKTWIAIHWSVKLCEIICSFLEHETFL